MTNQIPLGTLAYFRTRNRGRLYEAVLQAFIASGLTCEELAARMGKPPLVIERFLGAPGDWTLDRVSDVTRALGVELSYGIQAVEGFDD